MREIRPSATYQREVSSTKMQDKEEEKTPLLSSEIRKVTSLNKDVEMKDSSEP